MRNFILRKIGECLLTLFIVTVIYRCALLF